jgi:hypothetical protein
MRPYAGFVSGVGPPPRHGAGCDRCCRMMGYLVSLVSLGLILSLRLVILRVVCSLLSRGCSDRYNFVVGIVFRSRGIRPGLDRSMSGGVCGMFVAVFCVGCGLVPGGLCGVPVNVFLICRVSPPGGLSIKFLLPSILNREACNESRRITTPMVALFWD